MSADTARRPDLLAHGELAGDPALLSRLDRRRAGRADNNRLPPNGARSAGCATRNTGQARRDRRLLLLRRRRGRRSGHPTTQAVRIALARSLQADALPWPASDARPVFPPRLAVLHP